MGAVSVDEGMVTADDNSENVASDFGDDVDDGHMPFSELLSDPEKDEGQDPPSSTTGEHGDKPGKRANQGRTWRITKLVNISVNCGRISQSLSRNVLRKANYKYGI